MAALLKTRRDARFLLRSVPSDCLTKAPSAEKTVSVHLSRVRRRLLTQLGEDYPFDGGAPEGASS